MSILKKSPVWKKVAVTGTAGTIGRAVALRLAELGYELVLLDKRPMADPPARFIQTDLREISAVRAALRGVDAICHIGEVPNILPGMTGEEVFDANTSICRTMLEVAGEVGVRRIIYTSSCQVYGYWGTRDFPKDRLSHIWPLDEHQPLAPPNKYAESKVFNERACEKASGSIQVLIYRFPWVVQSRASDRAIRFWNEVDKAVGEGFWSYLDLGDAVESYVHGLDPTGSQSLQISGFEAFHFVADEAIGSTPIREKMAKHLPDWPPIPEGWGTHQPPVSCEKAWRLLGWKPKVRMGAVICPSAIQTNRQDLVTDVSR